MFLPVVADQLVQAVQRIAQRRNGAVLPSAGAGTPAVSGPWVTAAVRSGVRYQLLRALRAMDGGEMMLVQRRIPSLPEHLSIPERRLTLFNMLRDASGWLDLREVEPLLVPGTAYPGVIGTILLRLDCCAPAPSPHWVPNLRFFFLTERGHEMALTAESWWSGLNTRDRLRAVLLE